MQHAQPRCAAKMVKLMIRATGYEISTTGGNLRRWGMGPGCASLEHESDPSQLRCQRPSCKAAEGSRTPRRFAHFVSRAYLRQVLEHGCPLPLLYRCECL